MARRVENWVQEQVDLTVHGRLRRRSESKMEAGGPDAGGGTSPKKSKKTEAAAEQRKTPRRRVKGSGKSDGRELRSRPTKRKREEPAEVAAQQDHGSRAEGAAASSPARKQASSRARKQASLPATNLLVARRVRHMLFENYNKAEILVDNVRGRKPARVHFQQNEKSKQPVDKDDYFAITYHQCADTASPRAADGGILEFLSPRWRKHKAPTISSNQNYQDTQTLLEGLRNALKFNIIKDRWTPTDYEIDYIAEKCKVLEKNPTVGQLYSPTRMIDAFSRRMTKSAGQSALQSIVDLATIVSFGKEKVQKEELVMSFDIGSSDSSEKFPVNQAPGSVSQEGNSVFNYGHSSSVSSPEAEYVRAVGRTRSCSSGSSGSANSVLLLKLPSGGIYADVITVSGCQPDFPHFVLVGQVKSTSDHVHSKFPFSEAVEAQLICEMLGAMLHQSYVIGILFNDRGARLFDMQMNLDEKKISVTAKDYCFVDEESIHFCSSQIMKLFSDLVFAFEYAKEQTKEIQHWPAQ